MPLARCSSRVFWTNSIAPTSRPLQGCRTTRIVGAASISRARISFCWLPPESRAHGLAQAAQADVVLADQLGGAAADQAEVEDPEPGDRPAVEARAG